MTHRPYTPPAWQAKPLADGRVTLLVVPLKHQPGDLDRPFQLGDGTWHVSDSQGGHMSPLLLPYAPGDLIWCREAWRNTEDFGLMYKSCSGVEFNWRSPITMPKWAARTWLRCTGVEVRRVQTISHAETIRNGRAAYANSLTIDCDTPTPRDDFAKAFPNFAANPWAAFTTVEKISKEDV